MIEEFGKLTDSERAAFFQGVGMAYPNFAFEETPEFIAFIEEGIRSAEEEPMIPLEKVIEEVKTWNTKSP